MLEVILQLTLSAVLTGIIYALMAIGLTLIFGVVRVINFAHGEFLMLSMYATYFLFHYFRIDPYVSILIVPPLLFILGLLTQRVIIKPVMKAPPIIQMFITLMLAIAL